MRRLMSAIVALGAGLLLAPALSLAQDGMVKIGVLDDMSGPYSENSRSRWSPPTCRTR